MRIEDYPKGFLKKYKPVEVNTRNGAQFYKGASVLNFKFSGFDILCSSVSFNDIDSLDDNLRGIIHFIIRRKVFIKKLGYSLKFGAEMKFCKCAMSDCQSIFDHELELVLNNAIKSIKKQGGEI